MPWQPSDAHKKNHSIETGSKKSRQWSEIANSVLKRTGDEGLAIREANGVAKRRAEGGGVGDEYNTVLSPSDEKSFQQWKAINAPHDSGADYDMRGAYKSGLSPSAENGHWPDTYKNPIIQLSATNLSMPRLAQRQRDIGTTTSNLFRQQTTLQEG